jgi:hypothetical protein
MKKLICIFVIIASSSVNAQFTANEWGFILNQYIRTKESRKEFVEKFPEISEYSITSVCTKTLKPKLSYETIDLRIDSLLSDLPEFNKFKYKITYSASYNDFHIAISETIKIQPRFKIRNGKRNYVISFEYWPNIDNSNIPVSRYIKIPDTC